MYCLINSNVIARLVIKAPKGLGLRARSQWMLLCVRVVAVGTECKNLILPFQYRVSLVLRVTHTADRQGREAGLKESPRWGFCGRRN